MDNVSEILYSTNILARHAAKSNDHNPRICFQLTIGHVSVWFCPLSVTILNAVGIARIAEVIQISAITFFARPILLSHMLRIGYAMAT